MDEKDKNRKKSTQATNHRSPGDKLKNETTAGEAMRKKIRHGKKDHHLSKEEIKKKNKIKQQGRKKIYAETMVTAQIHRHISQSEEDNVGTKALNEGIGATETGIYVAKKNHYSNRLHEKRNKGQAAGEKSAKQSGTSSNAASREVQKKRMKKQAVEKANRFGDISGKLIDKAEELTGMIAKFVMEHPMEMLIATAILLVLLVVIGSFSSCSMMAGGVQNVMVATSYTAEDEDILAVDTDYAQLETDLQSTINHIESNYPGYDEYQYSLANIGHNPYQLAALLTVLYENYTEAEVQSILQTIFDAQYDLNIQRVVETRTRKETRIGTRIILNADGTTGIETYTYEVDVEYEYYILKTTLVNATLDSVVNGFGLTSDQMQRYQLLLETYGNKAYLFGDDIYSTVEPGEYQDYEIPPEALTDQKFANMIHEAEKYLGYPYVWGGASPSTSFDCSGFVSYVINHCGNGWNMGRQTANGLLGNCTRISNSEAKPGDLIFFQGTYNVRGASHVGIYVGNGMMIHCGNPIQYTSINTTYWQNHFYTFGRIND